jgi:hypothetical protein
VSCLGGPRNRSNWPNAWGALRFIGRPLFRAFEVNLVLLFLGVLCEDFQHVAREIAFIQTSQLSEVPL